MMLTHETLIPTMTTTTTTIPPSWLSGKRVVNAQLLRESEVPRRYEFAALQLVKPQALVTIARRYSDQFWDVAPQGVAPLFLGAAGQYKTMTAAAIAHGIRAHYLIDVAWCDCASEFTKFDRESFDPATKARMDWLKTAPFLVMDDFTQVPSGGRMMHTLSEIGCTRYNALLPTLWTGNVLLTKTDRQPLINAVGAALARRILETSDGFAAQVRG